MVDNAGILSARTETDLTAKLASLEQQTHRQLLVVTLRDLQGYEIEDYGYQLGRAWGIGRAAEDDGVLFIVAPNDRAVRIEVGYGLEPILTDALSSVILNERVLPRFRDGDLEAGVVGGADALIEQLRLPADQAEARAVAAAEQAEPRVEIAPLIITLIVVFWIVMGMLRAFGGRRRRRGGLSDAAWLWPILYSASRDWGRGGGRGGWGGGGGWSGGGGFSGGGGSFGGGGASGRW